MMGKIGLIGAILLLAGITRINGGNSFSQYGKSETVGRLLTPEEGCGFTKVKNNRIVGGSEAKIGAWPWMALLGYEKELVEEKAGEKQAEEETEILFDCGGSLITSRHVLTAAHCLDTNLIVVRLGEHDLRTTDDGQHQDILIDRFVEHENYNDNTLVYDIAMLYLLHDVEFSDRIRPICLPLDEPFLSRSFVDTNPFVAGWGDIDGFYHNRTDVLLQLQIPVVDTERCRQQVKQILNPPRVDAQINDRVICARLAGDKGVWKGDSGGPLMLPIFDNGSRSNPFPFYQIGIVSFTYSYTREDVPDIYTRVQYFADWIKKYVKE